MLGFSNEALARGILVQVVENYPSRFAPGAVSETNIGSQSTTLKVT
jgi:hypothetical protein